VVVTVVAPLGDLHFDQAFVTDRGLLGFVPERLEMLVLPKPVIAQDGTEVARIQGTPLIGQEKPYVGVTSDTKSFIGFEDGYPVMDGLKFMLEEVESIIADIEATL